MKGNFDGEKVFSSSIPLTFSSDCSDEGDPETGYAVLDLKELFVYKTLEFLGLGPKVL